MTTPHLRLLSGRPRHSIPGPSRRRGGNVVSAHAWRLPGYDTILYIVNIQHGPHLEHMRVATSWMSLSHAVRLAWGYVDPEYEPPATPSHPGTSG